MKIYKTQNGIVIENENRFYLLKDENWDEFINDDRRISKSYETGSSLPAAGAELIA
jgi:hypothetical protein